MARRMGLRLFTTLTGKESKLLPSKCANQRVMQSLCRTLVSHSIHNHRSSGQPLLSRHQSLRLSKAKHMSSLSSAKLGANEDMLETQWANGEIANYPLVWLRDNCQCEFCYFPGNRTRIISMQQLNPKLKVENITVDSSNHLLTINWRDGHQSSFDFDWLMDRRFTESGNELRAEWFQLEPRLWGSELMERLMTDTYDNLMTDDSAVFRWLKCMEEDGIFLIKGAPAKSAQITELSSRIGELRLPTSGDYRRPQNVARITVQEPTHVAFRMGDIPFYTDLPYKKYCPGMQMMHCIQPGGVQGGVNMYADGFHVAKLLKEQYPEHYETLCSIAIDFFDVSVDYYKYHKITSLPTFVLDVNDNVERIVYNNQLRDSFLTTDVKSVLPLYEALHVLDKLMYDEENHIEFKLSKGDVICFYNYRVLHGRTAMQEGHGLQRHLESGYVDWEDMIQQRRELQVKFGAFRSYEQ